MAEMHDSKYVSEILTIARKVLGAEVVVLTSVQRSRRSGPAILCHLGCGMQDACVIAAHMRRVLGDESVAKEPQHLIPSLARLDFRTAISVPVDIEDNSDCLLHFFGLYGTHFSHPELARTFASQVGLSARHHRLRDGHDTLLERLRVLHALDELATADDSAQMSAMLLDTIGPVLGVEKVAVMRWDPARDVLYMVLGGFGAEHDVAASYQLQLSDPKSNAVRVFTSGESYISNDAQNDPGIRREYAEVFGVDRVLTMPLTAGDKRLGILHLANKRTDFTVGDIERAEVFTTRIGAALDVASKVLVLRRERQTEELLTDVAVRIACGDPIDSFLDATLSRMAAITNSAFVAIVRADAAPVIARANGGSPDPREAEVLKQARGIAETGWQVDQPARPGDPGSTAVFTPVQLDRQWIGTLCAARARAHPYAPDECNAFTRLASLSALGWANVRYQHQRAAIARMIERQRIATDLHDDVSQLLCAAQIGLDRILDEHRVPRRVTNHVRHAQALLVRADTSIRDVINNLSEGATSHLVERLNEIAEAVGSEFALDVELKITPSAESHVSDVDGQVVQGLCRVGREALVNTAKHACARVAVIEVDFEDAARRLILRITDDGTGFDCRTAEGRHGIDSMRRTIERLGGSLSLKKRDEGGTSVEATIPARSPNGHAERETVPTVLTHDLEQPY